MKLNFKGDIEDLRQGILKILQLKGVAISDKGIEVKIEKGNKIIGVHFENGKGLIQYSEKIHFFRALGLFIENLQNKEEFHIYEEPQFKTDGVMIDCSRNAVLKVNSLKIIINTMALMGLNAIMLYMEDTYAIKDEPFFGYMRGRYTYDELKEIDDYAYSFGIEVIPCIQTLAHLENFLRWEESKNYRDTDNILIADEDNTYSLIEKMIVSASAPFRSKRIHIGMDEAQNLGRGKYLDINGCCEPYKIMNNHLKKVVKIALKYNLKPIMWSDMFFRMCSKTHDYYDLDVEVPKNIAENIPKCVQLVYWDYYHDDKDTYTTLIEKHKQFNSLPVFAGGLWTWMGIGTNHGKTFITTNSALQACKEQGVEEIFVTAWMDDGAENNVFNALLGMQLYAEYGYSKKLDTEKLKKRVEFCTEISFDAFMSLKYIDELPINGENNLKTSNPSKFLLWQDILIGLFDKHIEKCNVYDHYENLENIFKNYSIRYKDNRLIFDVPEKLCAVLKLKADIGVRIKDAYDSKNMKRLAEIADKELPCLLCKVRELRETHRNQWFTINKPFGWEVIDIRYGGLISRIETAIYRIKSYIKEEIESIDELGEEKLYFNGALFNKQDGLGSFNTYNKIVTSCTLWN